jgi:hypothetical protein
MIIREPCGKIYYKNSKLSGKKNKKKTPLMLEVYVDGVISLVEFKNKTCILPDQICRPCT